jgi:hypothetical protein
MVTAVALNVVDVLARLLLVMSLHGRPVSSCCLLMLMNMHVVLEVHTLGLLHG